MNKGHCSISDNHGHELVQNVASKHSTPQDWYPEVRNASFQRIPFLETHDNSFAAPDLLVGLGWKLQWDRDVVNWFYFTSCLVQLVFSFFWYVMNSSWLLHLPFVPKLLISLGQQRSKTSIESIWFQPSTKLLSSLQILFFHFITVIKCNMFNVLIY